MPIYEFECDDCGLRFETMRKMSESDAPMACPECKAPETKKLVSASNFAFAHTPVGGPRPQNTGVHSIDYNADRVIGRDAEARRKVISERSKAKDTIIRDERQAGKLVNRDQLVRTQDGYRTITEPERVAANQAREMHKQAMNAIEAKTSEKKVG